MRHPQSFFAGKPHLPSVWVQGHASPAGVSPVPLPGLHAAGRTFSRLLPHNSLEALSSGTFQLRGLRHHFEAPREEVADPLREGGFGSQLGQNFLGGGVRVRIKPS